MIRFTTLGGLDLRDDSGRVVEDLVGQHKRVALLAYLAIEHAGRFCRRDTLLAVFWPEHDTSAARNALSQALHVLRRALGPGVVVNRGQEEIGIDAARVMCDACEFEARITARACDSALRLYSGELLPGFFLADAPEFERWLESRRATLRAHAVSGAWQLCDDHERAGRLHDAIEWARRARSLAPTDETGVRRLLDLLDRAGNRAAAIAEYEAFVELLADELSITPSPETRARADRIRARDATPAAQEAPAVSASAIDGVQSGGRRVSRGSTRDAGHALARPARARVGIGTLGLAVCGAIVLALSVSTTRGRSADLPRPRAIAVLPFTVRGEARYEYLGAGVADLVGAQLADGDSIRAADTHAVLGLANRTPDAAAQPGAGRDIAKRVGADGFVLGSVVAIGGRVELEATLYDLRGNMLGRAHAGPADVSDAFKLVDELAGRLFVRRPGARGSDLVRVAEATTTSHVALTAFLEGEADFRVGRYAEAVAAFGRAVGADSAFAIAQYRLAMARLWHGGDITTPMSAAQRLADRLPRHHRELVQAGMAWLRGENTRAERAYREIVARYPDDVEAWNQLVEIQFHTNAARGRDPLEAQTAAQRVLVLDPYNANAIWHLALLHADDAAAFDSITRRALALGPDAHHSIDIRALRAYLLGDVAERARMSRELAEASDPPAAEVVALRAAVFGGKPRTARELMLTPVFESDGQARAEAALRRARYAAASGQIDTARRDIGVLRALHFGTYAMERASLDLLPYVRPTSDELSAARGALASWDAARDPGRGAAYVPSETKYFDALRLHLLARVASRMGDAAGAHRYIGALALLPRGERASLIDALAHSARAFVLADEDSAPAALAELDSAYREVWYPLAGESAPYAQAADRFLRGELLERLGRDDQALRWYATAERNSLDDLWYLAISHRKRAAIYRRQARWDLAGAETAAVAELWRDADASVISAAR